jgi:hypothetical protein
LAVLRIRSTFFRIVLGSFWVRFFGLLLILKDFFGSFRQNQHLFSIFLPASRPTRPVR